MLEIYQILRLIEQFDFFNKLKHLSYASVITYMKLNKSPPSQEDKTVSKSGVMVVVAIYVSIAKGSLEVGVAPFKSVKKIGKMLLFKNIMYTECIILLQTICKRVRIMQTLFDW